MARVYQWYSASVALSIGRNVFQALPTVSIPAGGTLIRVIGNANACGSLSTTSVGNYSFGMSTMININGAPYGTRTIYEADTWMAVNYAIARDPVQVVTYGSGIWQDQGPASTWDQRVSYGGPGTTGLYVSWWHGYGNLSYPAAAPTITMTGYAWLKCLVLKP